MEPRWQCAALAWALLAFLADASLELSKGNRPSHRHGEQPDRKLIGSLQGAQTPMGMADTALKATSAMDVQSPIAAAPARSPIAVAGGGVREPAVNVAAEVRQAPTIGAKSRQTVTTMGEGDGIAVAPAVVRAQGVSVTPVMVVNDVVNSTAAAGGPGGMLAHGDTTDIGQGEATASVLPPLGANATAVVAGSSTGTSSPVPGAGDHSAPLATLPPEAGTAMGVAVATNATGSGAAPNATLDSLHEGVRSQARFLLDAFAFWSLARARCTDPFELYSYRADCALDAVGGPSSAALQALVPPLLTQAASHVISAFPVVPAFAGPAKTVDASPAMGEAHPHLWASQGMAALAAKNFVEKCKGQDPESVAVGALRTEALAWARRAARLSLEIEASPRAQAMQIEEIAGGNVTVATAWEILQEYPCKRLEDNHVSCRQGVAQRTLTQSAALKAIIAESTASELLVRAAELLSEASPKAWVPTCSEEAMARLHSISQALPPDLSGEMAKKSWTSALRHAGESRPTWNRKWCVPGELSCDQAALNLTSLQEEVFATGLEFPINVSGFLAPAATQMMAKAQASWEYMQAAACTANALAPESTMEYISRDPDNLGALARPLLTRTQMAEGIGRFSHGGGLANIPWFVPEKLSTALALVTITLACAYLMDRLKHLDRPLQLRSESPEGISQRLCMGGVSGCGIDSCHSLNAVNPISVPADGLPEKPHEDPAPPFVHNCCYVLVTLMIAGQFLTSGFAPRVHGYFLDRWWMQAFHNYVESFTTFMLAVSCGMLSKGVGKEGIKRLVARVGAVLVILSLVLMPLIHNMVTLHGDEWIRQNPNATLGTMSFLQAWLIWLLLTPILRMLKPPVMVSAAYAISWAAGYWFTAGGMTMHLETSLALLGFYVTGLALPVEWIGFLDQSWPKAVGFFGTVVAFSLHLWLAFPGGMQGVSSASPAGSATGAVPGDMPDYGLHFNAWQEAAARHSYFLGADSTDNAAPVAASVFWCAWTQRLAHQLLICWPTGLALMATVPRGRVFFTEWGSRFIYPLVGQVFSFWLLWGWLYVRFGTDMTFSSAGPLAWFLIIVVGAIGFSIFWACRPVHGFVQMVLEPSWIFDAFQKEEDPASSNMGSQVTLPFSHYVGTALITTTPPISPTWLYTTSRSFGQGTALRATLWFTFLAPVIWCLWSSACSIDHLRRIYSLQFVIQVNMMQIGFVVLINCLSPWPEKQTYHVNNPEYLKTIGCIVPCHKSAAEIVATVQSLLQFLKPEHIVVVDNGNSVDPLDDTAKRLEELDPRVVYMWVPIGMKTNALWCGLNRLPPSVEYVMHIDDDTEVPPDMVFDEHVWDHRDTDAISYGITMYQTGLVEKLVDFEFKQISQLRLFQSEFSTVWFQHGIIGIWRRQAFTEVLKEHPFLPFGEDNWNGTINLLRNKQMRQELRSCVITYAPSTLLPGTGDRQQGYGAANIWKQRAERWFVNAPRRFFIRSYLFFFYRHDTVMGNIVFRLLTIAHLGEIFAHLIIPMSLVAYAFSPIFSWSFAWQGFVLQLCLHWSQVLLLNYVFWRHRKDIQIDLQVCLFVPFYHWFLQVCYWYGHWRCLLWYVPFFPMRHGLYTEGGMTATLLQHIHKIETAPDICDAKSGSRLLSLEEGCTGMAVDTGRTNDVGLGRAEDTKSRWSDSSDQKETGLLLSKAPELLVRTSWDQEPMSPPL